jgi:hypothetical protein
MTQGLITASLFTALLGLGMPSAHAGPCSKDIAQFEEAVRQSASNPNAGPVASQSVGAQLDRQPTPGSVKQAEQQARTTFEAALALSKRLDAQGNGAGCRKALAQARRMYELK